VQSESQQLQPESHQVQPGTQGTQREHAVHGNTDTTQPAPPPEDQQQTAPQQQGAQVTPADLEQPAPTTKVPGKNPDTVQSETTATREKEPAPKKASILAEKFASDKSINERIAPGTGNDLSSKLTGEPIDSIKRNIGINDRFLIIRELMDGDNDAFNNLVQKLDANQNFDEAYSLIQSSFPEQMEHEGVKLLVRLARRRYLSR
jgi:hypothetical protein